MQIFVKTYQIVSCGSTTGVIDVTSPGELVEMVFTCGHVRGVFDLVSVYKTD